VKLGVGSWTFPWSIGVPGYPAPAKPLDVFDLLKLADSLGAAVVQYADNLPVHKLDQPGLKKLRQRADESGVAIEVGTRGIQPELLRRYLQIAKSLKAEVVRTLIYHRSGKLQTSEAVTMLNRILPEYERENVILAIENYELYTVAEYRAILNSVDSGHLGICLDPVNNFGTLESPRQVVEQLGEFVVNLHYKDFAIRRIASKMGYQIEGTPAGSGALDARWLLERLNASGRCRSVVIEQWVPIDDSIESTCRQELEWARQGMRFLRETIGDLGIPEEQPNR
jgi:sugar phosphate isomerase/epimerase